MPVELSKLGYTDETRKAFTEAFGSDSLTPARVVSAAKSAYAVLTDTGEYRAELSGRCQFETVDSAMLPAVGDWVALLPVMDGGIAIIQGVVPRRTVLMRKSAGKSSSGQVVAANVDRVFIVQALDAEWNVRRLERYLAAVRDGGAEPVVVLNKADLSAAGSDDERLLHTRAAAHGAPVEMVSAKDDINLDRLRAWLEPGTTVCFVGSSGVGKSTLINRLLGEEKLSTGEVRAFDRKGRHTTTSRNLLFLPGGAMVIDTPGMREFGLLDSGGGIDATFPEIVAAAADCKFGDCRHTTEPDCAVRAAVENGDIPEDRYQSYLKLRLESERYRERTEHGGSEKRRKEKKLAKIIKNMKKVKRDKY